jgi:RimJ/RimL family protein N-acetyltransferase
MFPILNDPRLYEFIGGSPRSIEELRSRYESLASGQSPDGLEAWLNWIVRLHENGAAIGYVQASVMDESADVAWVIGVAWQRQGYASEAALAMVEWLIARGLTSIRACVHPEHAASAGVARLCGLSPTDKMVDGEVVWRRVV